MSTKDSSTLSSSDHWAYVLFVKYPHLYLPVLESIKELALKQLEGLDKIFDEFQVRHGQKILDLSCGIGRHSIPLAKKGYQVVGYDPSPLYINKARECTETEQLKGLDKNKIRFYQGDLRDITNILSSNGEGKFDVILSIGTSYGYADEAMDVQMFKDLNQIAASNCLLIIQGINRDRIVGKIQHCDISNPSERQELHQINKFNFETSCLESNWKFYEKLHDNKTLNLILDLPISVRLYSLHELKK
jgi:cyclopropane fatty-acyl-phospholipid synthase-like methyltransferase